jgi:hypothetical protein
MPRPKLGCGAKERERVIYYNLYKGVSKSIRDEINNNHNNNKYSLRRNTKCYVGKTD